MSVKGYKVFNPDWTCREFQYAVGETFRHVGEIEVCEAGFHFCKKVADCFNYYDFDSNNKVAEIEAVGNVKTEGDKSVTDEIKIVRELSWHEVLNLSNEGKNCTGHHNTGDYNSGYYNSGDRNSGDYNSGNYNSGYRNLGDRNSGYYNTGNYNSGDRNSGYYNTGDRNSGNYNSGYYNTGYYNSGYYNSGNYNSGYRNLGNYNTGYRNLGNYNSGDRNSGDRNSGDYNSGDYNSGYYNSGNYNSSDRNSGDRNSGYYNSGHYNSGYYNSGDRNSGYYNSGYSNSGDWNSCDYSSGFFNSVTPPVYAFNKPLNISTNEFRNCDGIRILTNSFVNNTWISSDEMTDEEKQNHPEYECTGGYLKTVDFRTACGMMWDKLTVEEKRKVCEIPNFDASVFEEITGIDVTDGGD